MEPILNVVRNDVTIWFALIIFKDTYLSWYKDMYKCWSWRMFNTNSTVVQIVWNIFNLNWFLWIILGIVILNFVDKNMT